MRNTVFRMLTVFFIIGWMSGCDNNTAVTDNRDNIIDEEERPAPPGQPEPPEQPVLADGSCGIPALPVEGGSSTTPQNLCVPALAYDDNSLVLVWEKPQQYAQVTDYHVYMDGALLGSAEENNNSHSPAKAYIDQFYQVDSEGFHVKARIHNFTVTGLQPESSHRFTVRAVLTGGEESADSNVVTARTAALPDRESSITDYAVTEGELSDPQQIRANTAAIQQAIDDCAAGSTSAYACKVVVPAGTYTTGALFLRSNMTLQIDGRLQGSLFADDYPRAQGYRIYPYRPIRRPPSLLNVLEAHDQGEASQGMGTFENIRITGVGELDGNGWKTVARGKATGGDKANTLTRDELTGLPLPAQYIPSNAAGVSKEGILAAAQVAACAGQPVDPLDTASGIIASGDIYGNCRSSMLTARGVKNIYFGGVTVLNPAFHGIMFLESENMTINASVHQTYDANNGDGLEFGNSRNAIVLNNFFDTGDDVVNFAAGIGQEARYQEPQVGAWIFNNYIREGHGAVALGSNTGAWIEHILAEDNVLFTTQMGLRMKSTPTTGGGGRNILFRDNALKNLKQNAFIFTLAYTQTPGGVPDQAEIPSQFRDIWVRNVSVEGAGCKDPLCSGIVSNEAKDNNNSKGAPIEITGVASASEYGGRPLYHQDIWFDEVKFNRVKSVRLYYLRDSAFRQLSVIQPVAGEENATNSQGSCNILIDPMSELFIFVDPASVSAPCE